MSSGEESQVPRPRRLGARALAAIGTLLCLVVGGIIVSVFPGSAPKKPAPIARENPETPSEPRFFEGPPGAGANSFAAEIAAKQHEQDLRRAQLREMLAARPPASPASASPAEGSPLFLSGVARAIREEEAAVPVGPAGSVASLGSFASVAPDSTEPPPGVYRPYPVRSPRPFAPVPPTENRAPSSLARALEAPILFGAPREPVEALREGIPRPPSPPDFKALLSQLQGRTSGEGAGLQGTLPAAPASPAVDFGRVVWAPAILLTALSSESPGPAEAWIEADTRDRQGRVVLPQGSRVFGSYETGSTLGQRRLVVRWTSVELPNGAAVALDGASSAGRDGSGGLRGRVDARLWGVFGRALFLSAIGAATQLGQPQESGSFGAPASNRQIAAASVANELARAATDVIRQATEIKPVLRVPAGSPFFVFVPADYELR